MIRYKYPRTPHLPWSPGNTHDDILLVDTSIFEGQQIVVTEKMDGENTSIYPDHIHARSTNSAHHPSRSWVKALQAKISADIPEGWRLCGENMYAEHSIVYNNLESYFYLFAVYDDQNICLNWQETGEWATLLGLSTPKVLYQGLWDDDLIRNIEVEEEKSEGYVARLERAFPYSEFALSTAKWVRENHVQTSTHWIHGEMTVNKLGEENETDI
jgi:hypothetical protein